MWGSVARVQDLGGRQTSRAKDSRTALANVGAALAVPAEGTPLEQVKAPYLYSIDHSPLPVNPISETQNPERLIERLE